jgi:YVTN family beta-propeller protein
MLRRTALLAALLSLCAATGLAVRQTVLPSGWRLSPPQGALAATGTMPQGITLSPDGSALAVLESGVQPPALRVLDPGSLTTRAVISLPGAFGKPVWMDATTVLIAGGNADAVLEVNTQTKRVVSIAASKGSWPAAVAISPDGKRIAVLGDGDGRLELGTPSALEGDPISIGNHPADAVFSPDGRTLYASVRQTSEVVIVDAVQKRIAARIPVGLHPGALALSRDGATLYVAESDDDSVGIIETHARKRVGQIAVGLHDGRLSGYGASPNGLLLAGSALFVSLGAENAVAVVRNGRVTERIPAGWYPTGVALGEDGTLFIVNGKGERAPANPQFDPLHEKRSGGYVAAITVGSVRSVPVSAYAHDAAETAQVLANAMPQWTPAPAAATVLRPGGPIRHVIYVIKENRSYDQVLGDLSQANGDPKLTWFGKAITPNQHALAERFGIFDNAYTNSQVSADGHNWLDAGIANDYVERFWPQNYGGRRDLFDTQTGTQPDVPHSGYLWDSALRARVSFRDYGEDLFFAPNAPIKLLINTMPGLTNRYDPKYAGWDLTISDGDRYAEWLREFQQFVRLGTLPQLEIVYFPDDHTSGTKPGARTPQAHVAANDWALGRLVDTVSHSPYWRSTAIFAIEDDAQNGPDHVSDQRSTFYVASPYARGGVQHTHYSSVSVLHSIELLLGLPPLSIYDATARPMYDAFAMSPVNSAPFSAVRPNVDLEARNTKAAYGAAISAKLDFREPDEADARVLDNILAHSVQR